MSHRTFRSSLAPVVAILCTAGTVGCSWVDDWQKELDRRAAVENQNQKKIESTPTPSETLEQIRQVAQAFLDEHHPDLSTQGFDFTQMTPNCFLIGAKVTQKGAKYGYVKHLTAERLREVGEDEDGDASPTGNYLWVIDYADPQKMADLAGRHGFSEEVKAIHDRQFQSSASSPWGERSWLDDYLLWHFLFGRPSVSYYAYNNVKAGFQSRPTGYRFYAPDRPFREEDTRPFGGIASGNGGRSMAFVSGRGWTAPQSNQVSGLTGQPYAVRGSGGGVVAKGAMGAVSRGGFGTTGSVSRGGFGAAGRASGVSGS